MMVHINIHMKRYYKFVPAVVLSKLNQQPRILFEKENRTIKEKTCYVCVEEKWRKSLSCSEGESTACCSQTIIIIASISIHFYTLLSSYIWYVCFCFMNVFFLAFLHSLALFWNSTIGIFVNNMRPCIYTVLITISLFCVVYMTFFLSKMLI